MTRFPKISLEKVTTISLTERPRKVDSSTLAQSFAPAKGGDFSLFVDTLPDVLKARDLRELAAKIAEVRKSNKKVGIMIGGHVIKTGLAPVLIDMMRGGIITSIAMNSAAAIHDSEYSLFGHTSEDVEANIQDGTFGMSRETGEFINGTLLGAMTDNDVGYGEALGREILRRKPERVGQSVLAQAYELNIPLTVHAAIGTDIVHQQPTMRGDVTGEMSFRDFRLFVSICAELQEGVALNIGSAVIMPEVFLKAVTVARNLKLGGRKLTTANFDMIQHYRPQMNILERPTRPDGKYYQFIGHHEIMIPLLCGMIKLAGA